MSDDSEREVFTRVLDALLREDHLGLTSRGRPDGPDRWQVSHPAGPLRIPIRPDGFQHPFRSAAPELYVGTPDGSRRVDTLDALLALLAPHGDDDAEAGWRTFTAECRADLRARRLAARSRERVHAEVTARRADAPSGLPGALLDDVLAAYAGHPVYPTDRCRHDLGDDDLLAYAPEHAPRFPLRWHPVPVAAVRLAGNLPSWWPAADRPDQLLVPTHPLTAARRNLPVVAPALVVRPTLSMRTVALDDDPYTHLKLPLPTASLGARNRRSLQPGTLADGAAVAGLLDRIAAAEPAFAGRIRHADEGTYAHTDDEWVAFLLRRFPADLAGVQVVPVAALAATDPVAGTVAERVSGGAVGPLLEAYLDLLVDWHVHLWLRHGVALEAHPQNIHLLLARDGSVGLLYKDNDGARLDPRHRGDGLALSDERMWTRDPAELADVFVTITVHLAAAAPLLALAARGVPVPTPATALTPRLVAARDRWGSADKARVFTERVLDAPTLPVKAMLTAGTLLPKQRLGATDVNKYYRRTGPNYLRGAP
ncbi:IucA/IucC family protein [Micromonospora krabiensis]|uniref:Siderophore synthetase component n=1 Tax=Micromonospora krabiensis TaxID=307121 RepID=A0A1C3N0D6_9ACTN|nr:IucA/IucC family protein [Micromonospora krabiensis]SBV26039.1 Siderophore synthetase component [Micromonospora krabiensis]